MQEIRARYEDGVFKPEEKINLPENSVVLIKSLKVRGLLLKEDILEIKKVLETLPKSRIDFKKLNELYYDIKISG